MAWPGGDAPPREPTLQEVLGAFMSTITQANVDANARGAIDAQRTTDMMQFMMQQGQQMYAQMAQGFQSMATGHDATGTGDAAAHGYRALKPKKDMTRITADNARTLMSEISNFEIDLNELGVAKLSEAAYRQLRSMAEGKAKDVVDIETVQGSGKELLDRLTWAVDNHRHRWERDELGGRLYNHLVTKLEDSVRLTPTKRLTIAEEIYAEAKMYDDTPQEAEMFLSRWRRSRYLMHKEGLVNRPRTELIDRLGTQGADAELLQAVNHSLEITERREMHTFLHQRVSKSVYEFIMSQGENEQAKNIDDCVTLIQKYCEVKARVLDKDKVAVKVLEGDQRVVAIDGAHFSIDDPRIAGAFHQLADFQSASADSREGEIAGPTAPIVSTVGRSAESDLGEHKDVRSDGGLSRDRGGQRLRSPPAGAKACPTCRGFHEEFAYMPKWLG